MVRASSRPTASSYIGPFSSGRTAQLALEALHETFPIRQCTRRLPLVAPAGASACVLADMGRCSAPCVPRRSRLRRGRRCRPSRHARRRRPGGRRTRGPHRHPGRPGTLRGGRRRSRDRLGAFLRGASRAQRFAPLSACPELVAAPRTRRRRLGGRARPLRPARRHRPRRSTHRSSARRSPPCRRRASTSRPPSRPLRRPTPRRPTWCSPGSTSPASDSWRSRPPGPTPCAPHNACETRRPRWRRCCAHAPPTRWSCTRPRRSVHVPPAVLTVSSTLRTPRCCPPASARPHGMMSSMLTAIVLIDSDAARIPEVAAAIADITGVQRGLLRHRRGRPRRHGPRP